MAQSSNAQVLVPLGSFVGASGWPAASDGQGTFDFVVGGRLVTVPFEIGVLRSALLRSQPSASWRDQLELDEKLFTDGVTRLTEAGLVAVGTERRFLEDLSAYRVRSTGRIYEGSDYGHPEFLNSNGEVFELPPEAHAIWAFGHADLSVSTIFEQAAARLGLAHDAGEPSAVLHRALNMLIVADLIAVDLKPHED